MGQEERDGTEIEGKRGRGRKEGRRQGRREGEWQGLVEKGQGRK